MYLPMAHAEGKFVAANAEVLGQLREQGRLAIRYSDGEKNGVHDEVLTFPHNPNGADANVAGVCDASGRVFGLMPHPERAAESALGCDDGKYIFESILS